MDKNMEKKSELSSGCPTNIRDRIMALVDVYGVKTGEVGGFIETEEWIKYPNHESENAFWR